MSVPTEFDFAVLKIGDGATPTELFEISCGKADVTMNFVANTQDQFPRDCATPNTPAFRKTKTTGLQADVTATGVTDKSTFGKELAYLGKIQNVKVELYADDGTPTGLLLGTAAGKFNITALNIGAPRDSESSAEVVMASHGAWTWTAV